MVGIYKIKNIVTNKEYLGSSKEIEVRFKRHLRDLKNGKHHNTHLQRSWDKYGEDNFKFQIIEECEIDDLLNMEQHYLDMNIDGYNIGKTTSGGDNISNHPDRDDIVYRMTISLNKRYNDMAVLARKLKYGRLKEDNPNWRGGTTFCECGTRINTTTKSCIICQDRCGENNPFYGKKHSEETKGLLSKKGKERGYVGTQNISIIIDGVKYMSLGEASVELEIPITTIRWRVKSKNSKFEGYQYVS